MLKASILLILIVTCVSLQYGSYRRTFLKKSTHSQLGMLPLSDSTLSTLVTAIEEAKPDDYVYGAVNAPNFVLPLAAFGVIALAAIPFLLAPGEEALEQQRRDEEEKGAAFNRRQDKDLR